MAATPCQSPRLFSTGTAHDSKKVWQWFSTWREYSLLYCYEEREGIYGFTSRGDQTTQRSLSKGWKKGKRNGAGSILCCHRTVPIGGQTISDKPNPGECKDIPAGPSALSTYKVLRACQACIDKDMANDGSAMRKVPGSGTCPMDCVAGSTW